MVVMAGLLGAPIVVTMDTQPQPQPKPSRASHIDERLLKLERFFAHQNCPLRKASADFLEAADRYSLDWRLLPSISMVESGGGKAYRNNNVLGWDSGNRIFPSVRAGIHQVASRLATSGLYRHKDVDQILYTYNPHPEYITRVKWVMRQIDSSRTLSTGLN